MEQFTCSIKVTTGGKPSVSIAHTYPVLGQSAYSILLPLVEVLDAMPRPTDDPND